MNKFILSIYLYIESRCIRPGEADSGFSCLCEKSRQNSFCLFIYIFTYLFIMSAPHSEAVVDFVTLSFRIVLSRKEKVKQQLRHSTELIHSAEIVCGCLCRSSAVSTTCSSNTRRVECHIWQGLKIWWGREKPFLTNTRCQNRIVLYVFNFVCTCFLSAQY